jgi:ornithine cyclodeaminase/alanine dehydrogenase
MLHLREEDVERLLTMKDALREVEAALRDFGQGKAENRPRQRVRASHAILNVMSASWSTRGYLGFKYYSASRESVRFWLHLLDASTGALLAIMEADRLGQQRTGAASGVATKVLAREDASTVGIIGTGWQAESQLEAMCGVRSVKRVHCFSRERGRREGFSEKMTRILGVDVRPVDSAEEAVHQADVVITATNTTEPVVHGRWLEPGVHINAIGANRLESRELDDDAIQRCTLVAADSVEQARQEAGDLERPVAQGLLRWETIHEIGNLVAGTVPGRKRPEDITLFKSLGLAIEDVAVGAFVYERATEEGFGKQMNL